VTSDPTATGAEGDPLRQGRSPGTGVGAGRAGRAPAAGIWSQSTLDATIVIARSEKQEAAPTWKIMAPTGTGNR
jgi:hypothetical protein